MNKQLIQKEDGPQTRLKIYLVRGRRVMLDSDLAELYGVRTKSLNLAVKRNSSRFPNDFMFQLTPEDVQSLRFQNETSNERSPGP